MDFLFLYDVAIAELANAGQTLMEAPTKDRRARFESQVHTAMMMLSALAQSIDETFKPDLSAGLVRHYEGLLSAMNLAIEEQSLERVEWVLDNLDDMRSLWAGVFERMGEDDGYTDMAA